MDEMKNAQTWECGRINTGDVIATLRGTTLTISGEGRMGDFYNKSSYVVSAAPWSKENIITAVIEEGVESIGSFAFANCRGLTTLSIAESVTTIGENSFSNCSAIKSITIPNNVRSIGADCFSSCISLESLTIPDSVRYLGDRIFYNCDSLKFIINESQAPQHLNGATFAHDYSGNYTWQLDDFKLFVPQSSIYAYKKAPFWNGFYTILPIEGGDVAEDNTSEQIDEEIEKLERQLENLRFRKALMRGLKGNPKQVADFMSLFNQRDGLKYLTHDMDENGDFDYDTVLIRAKRVCREYFEKLQLPQTLKELLNQFAFEDKPQWTSFDNQFEPKEIESGWSCSEWQQAKEGKLHPIKLAPFAEIIRGFKRTTRIESPKLETLIDKVFSDDSFEIEKKDLSKADFYTHVGEFKSALETISAEIQKRSDTDEKKKVSITYKRETSDDYFVRKIIITHHNSFPARDDKEALIKEWVSFEKGSMAKIAGHLQGYCHWTVETCIDREPVRINILREKETPGYETIDNSEVKGFAHVLTFYYQS